MNIIQIKGLRGLFLTGLIICCLAAGFIAFPGFVLMHLWNFGAGFSSVVPSIGLFQGVLLWGIIAASYFILFKKNKLIVCVKSPEGLSEEELKAVFADLKSQANNEDDIVLKSILKAKEEELKSKTPAICEKKEEENNSTINQ